jgi:hypothetical protein
VVLRATAVTLILIGVAVGCAQPTPDGRESAMASKSIEEVLAAHADSLLALPGVVGAAIGRCGDSLCIRVFVRDSSDAVRRSIPDSLEGHPVQVEVSGQFRPR